MITARPTEAEALEWFHETNRLNGQTKLPLSVFKFLAPSSRYFEENLTNAVLGSSLKLLPREKFNDPFDTAVLCEPGTIEDQREHIRELSERNGDQLHKNPKALDEFISTFYKDGCFDRDTQTNLSRMGIYSLAAEIENLLMWAHYADSHKGIALIFAMHNNYSHLPAMPVRYQEHFSRITPSVHAIDRLLFYGPLHKGLDWKYEREWRIVVPNEAGNQFPFHWSMLWGVVHGMRCEQPTRTLVAQLSLEWIKLGRSPLHLYDAKPRWGEYGLDFFEDVPVQRPHPINFNKPLPTPPDFTRPKPRE